jgi:hypothetical protein
MEEDIRAVAQRLYYKVKRANSGNVATVGITKSAIGKDSFIVYFIDGSSTICPQTFEGHGVIASTARPKAEGNRSR